MNATPRSITLSGILAGTGGLIKTGAGTLSLAGAAGTFGFEGLGAHARRIELHIRELRQAGPVHAHDVAEIKRALAALQATA